MPTIYFRTSPLFADRDVGKIWAQLGETISALDHAHDSPTYLMNACEIGGRRGLYARDAFNRSNYRWRLQRRGMKFATDPWVRFTDDGTFVCDDWGEFEPDFLVTLSDFKDQHSVVEVGGALLAFSISTYRLGLLGPEELRRLIDALGRLRGLAGSDPSTMADALNDW